MAAFDPLRTLTLVTARNMVRRAFRLACWIACALGAVVALLGLWGVLVPHPNQGFEVGVFLLKVGVTVSAVALVVTLVISNRPRS